MTDKTTTIEELKDTMRSFVDERDWAQFHTPKNLSMALAAEAAELMEFFMWVGSTKSIKEFEKNREAIEHEVADVAAYLLSLCAFYNIDLADAFEKKRKLNALKYPIDKSKGKWTKYTNL